MEHNTVFRKSDINDTRRAPGVGGIEPLTRFFDVPPIYADELPSAPKAGKKIQKQSSQSPSYIKTEDRQENILDHECRALIMPFRFIGIIRRHKSRSFRNSPSRSPL